MARKRSSSNSKTSETSHLLSGSKKPPHSQQMSQEESSVHHEPHDTLTSTTDIEDMTHFEVDLMTQYQQSDGQMPLMAPDSTIRDNPSTLKLYKRRWYLLAVFSLSAMLTSVYQMSFASIQKETLQYFDMDPTSEWNRKKVNLFALSYNMAIVVALLSSFLVKTLGLGPMINFAMVGHFLAGWIRFGGSMWRTEYGFWICFAGQALAALMQPSISYSSTLMSLNWFGEKERAIATTIASFSNLLGTGVAFALTTMVSEKSVWTIWITLLIHAVLATIAVVFGLPFFRSRPPTPANVASIDQTSQNISFFKDLWMLVTDINAIILAVTFGLGFGCISSFLSLIGTIVSPRGYEGTDASIFGLLVIFCGGFGAIIFGVLVDRTRRYRLLMWVSGLGALVSLGVFTFVIRYDKSPLYMAILCVSSATLGGFALPFVPIVMELACEISYPVSANVSNVVFGSAGTFCTIAFILILQELETKRPGEEHGSMQNAMYVVLGCFVLAMTVFIFFRGKNKRSIVEQAIRDGNGELDAEESRERSMSAASAMSYASVGG